MNQKVQVTQNKLAKFITAKSPESKERIVRECIRASKSVKGYSPFYMSLQTPAKSFVVGGAQDTAPLHAVIEKMKLRKGTSWKDTDSRVTTSATKALIDFAPEFQRLPVTFTLPPKRQKAVLHYPDTTVIVAPDLLVHGKRNNKPISGAFRFYYAKESSSQLGKRGAELVAAMEYLWLLRTTKGESIPDVSLCMVYECLQHRITIPEKDIEALTAQIERGAAEFAATWHRLETRDAA